MGCLTTSKDTLQPPSPDPELLDALCAFADHLATLPDPRDPRGVHHDLPVLLATLLVALAGGANSMTSVAAFTYDHQAWFRLWLPLCKATPSREPTCGWSADWTCSSGKTTAAGAGSMRPLSWTS